MVAIRWVATRHPQRRWCGSCGLQPACSLSAPTDDADLITAAPGARPPKFPLTGIASAVPPPLRDPHRPLRELHIGRGTSDQCALPFPSAPLPSAPGPPLAPPRRRPAGDTGCPGGAPAGLRGPVRFRVDLPERLRRPGPPWQCGASGCYLAATGGADRVETRAAVPVQVAAIASPICAFHRHAPPTASAQPSSPRHSPLNRRDRLAWPRAARAFPAYQRHLVIPGPAATRPADRWSRRVCAVGLPGGQADGDHAVRRQRSAAIPMVTPTRPLKPPQRSARW
ncbi:hypothetical protein DFR52_103318 [Hoeflea marina]|uniref:Uncharacterized protein n=1 Tax=Hoeflea marina TaxID=274592 RepID=A0A317PJP4_9HYPH|nr:hypothetical protein DFR52_103318 [Hoeflea marina]